MKCVDTITRIRRDLFVAGKTIKRIVRELHLLRNPVRWAPRGSSMSASTNSVRNDKFKRSAQADHLSGEKHGTDVLGSRERLWPAVEEQVFAAALGSSVLDRGAPQPLPSLR